MASVIVGNSLGLINNAANVPLLQNGAAATGRSGEKVTVNAATGNLVIQRQDELLIGRGPDLAMLRTYNSRGAVDYDNNDNWQLGFNRKLKALTTKNPNVGAVTTVSSITRVEADGGESIYTWDSARQAYLGRDGAGSYDTLTYNASAKLWTWTDNDRSITETYDWLTGKGNLLTQTDSDGNAVSFTYVNNLLTQVLGASGEKTTLTYTNTNLTQVSTVNASGVATTRVRYAYTTSNRLSRVTVDLSPQDNSIADNKTYVTDYTYVSATSTQVLSTTQSDGTSLTFAYDASNRVTAITDALGNKTTYAYNTTARATTVTDALGLRTVYAYDTSGRLASVTEPAVNGVSSTRLFAYNASGDVIQVTDGEGNALAMSYDTRGNLLVQRDAAGNTITRTYDTKDQLLTESIHVVPDPDGSGALQPSAPLTTRYVYDAAGKNHLRFAVSPEGRVTEYRYDAVGQRTSRIDYAGANL